MLQDLRLKTAKADEAERRVIPIDEVERQAHEAAVLFISVMDSHFSYEFAIRLSAMSSSDEIFALIEDAKRAVRESVSGVTHGG